MKVKSAVEFDRTFILEFKVRRFLNCILCI
nr:MAG TPA: hypothetical protein [Caudoviricetes sp.]